MANIKPSILHIAPHLNYPPLDGAERRTIGIFEALKQHSSAQLLIGSNVNFRYGQIEDIESHTSTRCDSKYYLALHSFILNRSYWQSKYCTDSYRKFLKSNCTGNWDIIILNFLYNLPLLHEIIANCSQSKVLIDTHNYDPDFFQSLGHKKYFYAKALTRTATKVSLQCLRNVPQTSKLLTVSASDKCKYASFFNSDNIIVVPNGCSTYQKQSRIWNPHPNLLFVGSLSAQMNQDALSHFADKYWPCLKYFCRFSVAGSNPPDRIRRLCNSHNWNLFRNATDDDLDSLYNKCDFAILPFEYGEGSKLKLLEAAAHGIPIVSTTAGACGIDISNISGIFVSNSPQQWKYFLTSFRPDPQNINQLVEFSRPFTWDSIAHSLIKRLA